MARPGVGGPSGATPWTYLQAQARRGPQVPRCLGPPEIPGQRAHPAGRARCPPEAVRRCPRHAPPPQ
eukprot:919401-Alexandrium_andersonii.AAC.1